MELHGVTGCAAAHVHMYPPVALVRMPSPCFTLWKATMEGYVLQLPTPVIACQVGGIRRIIVPVELGYPDNDFNKAGPKPSTFSGAPA